MKFILVAPVLIAKWNYPFPFRTGSSNAFAPTIVSGQPDAKIGRGRSSEYKKFNERWTCGVKKTKRTLKRIKKIKEVERRVEDGIKSFNYAKDSPYLSQRPAKRKDNRKGKEVIESMDELLSEYGSGIYYPSTGDRISGRVIRKEEGRLFVDIGAKTEGLVAEKAYREAEGLIKNLKEGDEVQVFVLIPETPEGYTILSLRPMLEEFVWKKIINSYEESTPILVFGKGVTSSGINVDLGGVTGFIPISQIGKEALKNPHLLVGKSFEAVVIDADRSAKRVILSEKEVSEKEEIENAKKAIKNIKEGEIFEGEVVGIYDFGCFVKIEVPLSKKSKMKVPLEGLVHISELSWEKVQKPSDVVKQGEKVKVKVIGKSLPSRKGVAKLAFSIKQTQKDPWEDVDKRYPKDARVSGKVVKISGFGIFVSLEPGIEGLVHITKIPPGKKYNIGDEVKVYVEDVDKEKKKLSLGLLLTEKPVGYK